MSLRFLSTMLCFGRTHLLWKRGNGRNGEKMEKRRPPVEAFMAPGRYFQGFLSPSRVPMLFHNKYVIQKLHVLAAQKLLNDNCDGPRESMLGI